MNELDTLMPAKLPHEVVEADAAHSYVTEVGHPHTHLLEKNALSTSVMIEEGVSVHA